MKRAFRTGPRGARGGYSFTEVLFAVMILGIGFIMVAALFPVAIQQSQTTGEEGRAAAIARAAVVFIEQNLRSVDLPATGIPGDDPMVSSLRDPQLTHLNRRITGPAPLNHQVQLGLWSEPNQLWNRLKGSLIVEGDPRYAWVMLYRRDAVRSPTFPYPYVPSPHAQVYIVVAAARTRPTYDASADLRPETVPGLPARIGPASNPNWGIANLQPRHVSVAIDGPKQQIAFDGPGSQSGAVAEGCYVIISSDNLPRLPPGRTGRMNGRIYRVGNRVGTGNTWELMPGYEFAPDPGRDARFGTADDIVTGFGQWPYPASGFVLGRTFNPDRRTYEGPAQDIAVYTTFVQMR